jgi:hypothetical protein
LTLSFQDYQATLNFENVNYADAWLTYLLELSGVEFLENTIECTNFDEGFKEWINKVMKIDFDEPAVSFA